MTATSDGPGRRRGPRRVPPTAGGRRRVPGGSDRSRAEPDRTAPGPALGGQPAKTDAPGVSAADSVAPPAGPTVDQVVVLQAVQSDPAVSLLLTTTPGPRMTDPDAARLRRMAQQAAHRIGQYRPEPDAAALSALRTVVELAVGTPMSAGLAVFASAGHRQVVPLPVPVRDRVVVDPTFATRDLVRALHRTPQHLVLRLSAGRAALFDGAAVLRPAVSEAFPMVASTAGARDPAAFLRRVDAALGAYRRLHPAPLVLVGPDRILAAFTRMSRHVDRLAGTIPGNLGGVPLADLAARVRPVLDRYLRGREQEALRLLEQRYAAGAAVSGMPAAWLAARHERPEMLVVEEGLFYPARLTADGDLVTPASDVTSPDVIDDLVDELIEVALRRGAWVALAGDGALAAHDGVALTLRTGR